jgi:hypothetical protein
MRREHLDALVLEGLQHRLMDPVPCDLFCAEYARHCNRLRREQSVEREADKAPVLRRSSASSIASCRRLRMACPRPA